MAWQAHGNAVSRMDRDLRRQVAALAKWFAELAVRTSQVAREFETPGQPPPDALIEDFRAARQAFADLRADVLQAAQAVSLTPPDIASLRDLEQVLGAIAEAVEAQRKRAVLTHAREQAFAVLDRVAGLVHKEDVSFAGLRTCQAMAQRLRDDIAASKPLDVDAQVHGWTEAIRPFADLVTMVDAPKSADDEHWLLLEDSVSKAFSRLLAVAAARGRLLSRGDG